MSYQPSLFDPPAAAAAREAGIAQAAANTSAGFAVHARRAIHLAATLNADFTADEVLALLDSWGVTTHNLAALGPVFLAAARAGEIEKTGEQRRTIIARRHRDLTVWRGSARLAR